MILENYNSIIDDFLKSFYDSNKSNLENWEHLFSNIDIWKTKYLIDSDVFRLHGAIGWYWEFFYCKFNVSESTDYISIMSLICWSISSYARKNGYYKNWSFINPTLAKGNFTSNSITSITKDSFFDEVSDQYQKSHKRFEQYVENYAKVYPDIVEKLTAEYPRFLDFFNGFISDLQECNIIRINEMEEDEHVWYFIQGCDCIHLILIQDFV